jgi:hypothetical protein
MLATTTRDCNANVSTHRICSDNGDTHHAYADVLRYIMKYPLHLCITHFVNYIRRRYYPL